MKPILFSFSEDQLLAQNLAHQASLDFGNMNVRHFPDLETYLQILNSVKDREVYLLCSLFHPNEKLMPLLLFADAAKELGAASVNLIAPYLAYMRQDKRFQEGEAISSATFAKTISSFFDAIYTVDPHLHRRNSLSEIYTISNKVLHAAPLLAQWIDRFLKDPLLIGPDEESKQWVSEVAALAQAPYVILEKKRLGDREVEISIPQLEKYQNFIPVLVDDIISTGKTMLQTLRHLQKLQLPPAICVGVHAVFSENAYEELLKGGAAKVVTCNTIFHLSNEIEIVHLLAKEIFGV